MNPVYQSTVTKITAVANRGEKAPAWNISAVDVPSDIFSLKGANVGETIFYDERAGVNGRKYLMHVEHSIDGYAIAKTEALKEETGKNNYQAQRRQAPISVPELVGIYAQILKEFTEANLNGKLIDLGCSTENISGTLTSIFIAATRERDNYPSPVYPTAAEVFGVLQDNVEEDPDDVLETL